MNAVERIEAAITVLKADRASYTPGPSIDLQASGGNTDWFIWAVALLKRDKRTIDAQLAILRAEIESLTVAPGWANDRAVQRALDLADAILGGRS